MGGDSIGGQPVIPSYSLNKSSDFHNEITLTNFRSGSALFSTKVSTTNYLIAVLFLLPKVINIFSD